MQVRLQVDPAPFQQPRPQTAGGADEVFQPLLGFDPIDGDVGPIGQGLEAVPIANADGPAFGGAFLLEAQIAGLGRRQGH